MQSFRPYVWLKKQGTQFNLYYVISIPSGYRVSGGIQSPVDDTTAGIRTYKFTVESNVPSSPTIIDNNVGNHLQPSNISIIEFQVIDDSDSTKPVKKGASDSNYQNGDDMG